MSGKQVFRLIKVRRSASCSGPGAIQFALRTRRIGLQVYVRLLQGGSEIRLSGLASLRLLVLRSISDADLARLADLDRVSGLEHDGDAAD